MYASLALVASCHFEIIQYALPHIWQFFHSFPILIGKHQENVMLRFKFKVKFWMDLILDKFNP